MAAGISISVASDTRAAAQGIKNGVLEPLEDAKKALTDVTREGDKTGQQLEDSMRDAQKKTDDLGDEFKKLSKTIESATRAGSTAMRRDFDEGTSHGKEQLKELGNEARQNASETFSSFDGSAQSFADGIQGTLGGIVSSLGPIGAVAGGVGALLIGSISGALTGAQEDADETAARVNSMFDDMRQSGNAFLSDTYFSDAISSIIQDTGKYAQAQQDAQDTGLSLSTVLKAQAGDLTAIAAVTEAANNKAAIYASTVLTATQIAEGQDQVNAAQAQGMVTLSQRYQNLGKDTDTAAAKLKVYNDATAASGPLTDAAAAKADGLSGSLKGIKSPDRIDIQVDTSTAQARIDAFKRQQITLVADIEARSGNRVL